MSEKIYIVKIKKLKNCVLYLEYSDGVAGEFDIIKIAAKPGMEKLAEEEYFDKVSINSETGDLNWPDGENLCKDAIYRQLSMKSLLNRLKIDERLI